ncbi:MAG: PD-(D/E)XK nuclease family protein [Gammaproteobacteria bacterium]
MIETAKRIGRKYSLPISKQLVGSWKHQYAQHFPYFRMREDIASQTPPHELILDTRLHHGQVYDYRYHRGKTNHLLASDKNGAAYHRMQAYLEGVPTDTPHDLFRRDAARASQTKTPFSLNEVAITPRQNKAIDMARFVLQTVSNNYQRHPKLQSFMLENDAVTIAVEVPIVLTHKDLAHYQHKLGFRIPLALPEDAAITGHIDILQIRNGAIQILDYKPNAKKDKPVEQLMIYALALSRLTLIPLYSFKCAWFDDEHYFEFYPLNVVHKKQNASKYAAKQPPIEPDLTIV